jgi:hypothetical protein
MDKYILTTSDVKFAAYLMMRNNMLPKAEQYPIKPHYEEKYYDGKKRTMWSWRVEFVDKQTCLQEKHEWLTGSVGKFCQIFDELMNQIKNTVIEIELDENE